MPVPDTYKPTDTKPESKHLRADEYPIDTKWNLRVSDVNMELMPGRDGKADRNRLIMSFAGKGKGLVLNATNQGFLEARLGAKPNLWIGATINLHRTTTVFGDETVAAFRIIGVKGADTMAKSRSTAPAPTPTRASGLRETIEAIDEGHAAQYDDDSVPF